MNDIRSYLHAITRVTLFFLSACLFAWVFYEPGRTYLAGLILGAVVSVLNMYHLAWKVQRFAYLASLNTGKRVNLGFITRVSLALLAVIFAHINASIEVVTTMIGLIFAQLVILILGIRSTFIHKSS